MGNMRTVVRTFLLVLCLHHAGILATSSSILQVSPPGENLLSSAAKEDAEKIIEAAFKTTIVYDRLAYMTDTIGPRFSGTPALERAIDWIQAAAEQEDGITVKTEPVMVPRWVRGNEYANLLVPRRKSMRILALGGSVGTNGTTLRGSVIVVSSFDDLESHKDQIKGKIVVYNQNFVSYGETVEYRVNGASRAEAHGALAALIRSVTPYSIQTPHTGSTHASSIPAVSITLEDAKMFARMQARGQSMEIELYLEAHTLPDVPSRNLILEVAGSKHPDEFVVLGGHTDSWDIADGAMDDGGGAFVAWEAVRLIKTLGLRPDRTIRAVLWTNEENGARGGQAYANDHISELDKHSIALESDVGTFTPHGLSFAGSEKARKIVAAIGKQLLSGIGSGNVSGVGIGEDVSYLTEHGVPSGSLYTEDVRQGNDSNNPCVPFSHAPYPQFNEENFGRSGYFWYVFLMIT
jgi:carboxypeptidase Q